MGLNYKNPKQHKLVNWFSFFVSGVVLIFFFYLEDYEAILYAIYLFILTFLILSVVKK